MDAKFVKARINWILQSTIKYQLARFDPTEYTFRDDLQAFLERHANLITGEVLEIGSGMWMWPKQRFSSQSHFRTLDREMYDGTDIVGDVLQLDEGRFTRQGWGLLLTDFRDVRIEWLGDELDPHHYLVSGRK